jgi:hypothetical protein
VQEYPATISLAGCELGEARHVCAFFNSREDEYGVTLPFIKDGFESGDKAVHIINPARRADHMQRLSFHGIDVPSSQRNGQLEVLDWKDTFFRDGPFDPDQQLALLEQVLRSGKEQGFRISRYVAHAEWALQEGASLDLLLEFEARVNHIWPRSADTVICCYDLSQFGGDIVIDAIRTHPMVIIGGILQQNPFFVPPDEFLREFGGRKSGRSRSPTAAA